MTNLMEARRDFYGQEGITTRMAMDSRMRLRGLHQRQRRFTTPGTSSVLMEGSVQDSACTAPALIRARRVSSEEVAGAILSGF